MGSYKACFVILLVALSGYNLKAQQLTASFTCVTSGCSPLTVSFKNTSTGTSPSATYSWDFGNGNASQLPNPSTTYSVARIDTVKLTVTDKGSTSVAVKCITVYPPPQLGFKLLDSIGCMPLSVQFFSTSTTSAGTITSYVWDFGDGSTSVGDSTTKNISHTYNASGKFNVKLAVKTSTGCASNSFVETGVVNSLLTPTASYARSKTYLCHLGDAVTFTNQTSNMQQASYVWIFGDGATFVGPSASHVYNTKGIFQDSLIATNADGCSDTSIYVTPLYNETFKSNFDTTGPCAKSIVSFNNLSNPIPDSSRWSFSNQINPVEGINATNQFDTAGIYQVQLINIFGQCMDTLNKSITILPQLTPPSILITNSPVCGRQTLLNASDTSAGSVAWLWNIAGMNETIKTSSANFTLSNDSSYVVSLNVTKASGCSATATDSIFLSQTLVSIKAVSNDSLSNTSGCAGLSVQFSATPNNGLKTYLWNFGDATTSTDTFPTHVYNNIGTYSVKLVYTTMDGCKDSVFLYSIQTFAKPKPSFSTLNRVNCGSKAYFFDQTPGSVSGWAWNFGDSTAIDYNQNPVHAFPDTGYFSVSLIAYNGTCYDSVTYTKYIDILAPFQHIDTVAYPCAGIRDTAYFFAKYWLVNSGTWDFGDGTALLNLDTTVHELYHVYPQTGTYRAILSATNTASGCTTHDTTWVHILLNQKPKLGANVTTICANDSIKVFIDTSTLQPNPGSSDSNYYSIYQWQYGDNTNAFTAVLNQQPKWYYNNNNLGILKGLMPGGLKLRAIIQSQFYGCLDTTNYINLKVMGPVANYTINNPLLCFRKPMTFIDSSTTNFGVPIKKWIWNFGDKTHDTALSGNNVTHYYKSPGKFASSLKVIDTAGCFSETDQTDTARPSGPKAAFKWKPSFIVTGSTATYTNTTNTFEDKAVDYNWSFTSDGSTSTKKNPPAHFYPSSLTDTVELIATAPFTGCTDTAIHIIPIRNVFALFDYKAKYINNNNCPPFIAYFHSHSVNAVQLRWNFGDGSPGTGITTDSIPSYTYNLPGVYITTLYAYNNNGPQDSTSDTITIYGAYATWRSNISQGCVPDSVTFFASPKFADSLTWDFGDGTVIKTKSDTVETHTYLHAGSFTPHLILTDSSQCVSSFPFATQILIDSLSASFAPNKSPICDSETVSFSSTVYDFANSPLNYHWVLGSNPKDTSDISNPSFYYTLGKYKITATVSSPVGCSVTHSDSITVVTSAKGFIAAPAKVCDSIPATFKGTVKNPNDSIKWKWIFGNGDTSLLQNPHLVYFTTGKDTVTNDSVMLVTALNNCFDTTTYKYLFVNPRPAVNLLITSKTICVGNKDTLTASDGDKNYTWLINGKINAKEYVKINDSAISVAPTDTSFYEVIATNKYACSASDSVSINVVPYLTLIVPPTLNVCKGGSVQLPVSGADRYTWLKDSATINENAFNSANPTVTPIVSPTIYEVEGFNSCFNTTKNIQVNIIQYPTVTTNHVVPVATGTSTRLSATVSPDVDTIIWSPATYLDCTECASPTATPLLDIQYTVTVKNKYGCTTEDTSDIRLFCTQSVYVPSAFTPGDKTQFDGRFYPRGRGIRTIKRFAIYNRFGDVVFEKSNIQVEDSSVGWDGTINGKNAPIGTYVYTLEAQCDTGGNIPPLQGTVVLIR